jgi:hypothetical protein
MNQPRLTLLETQHRQLVDYLEGHPDGHERGAIVLFRRLHIPLSDLSGSDRYIAQEVIPFDASWVRSSSPTHFDFKLQGLRNLFRRCEEEKLVFGFVHNHPTGQDLFSPIDDENERTLTTAIRNRNGKDVTFIAMLWAGEGWHARVRGGEYPETAIPVRHTIVTSQPLKIFGYQCSENAHSEIHSRGAAAFGTAFVDKLKSLRVGIVGNGGTGSPLATLGARAGFGEIVLIDDDELDASNLNRVRGLRKKDVGAKKSKKLKEFIDGIGLTTKVTAIDAKIDQDPQALDALASCDVVFGCTDDFVGRDVMNIALYAYNQVLIDMGLGGRILEDSAGEPNLRYHFGRISTVLPEFGECLFCQDVLRDVWIQTQMAKRANPSLTETEIQEKYLEDGGEEAPGVGPFTSATADFALATLFDLLKPFRRYPPEVRRDMFYVDFVKMELSSHRSNSNPDCPYCRHRHFLLLEEKCRLQRPALGKRNDYV